MSFDAVINDWVGNVTKSLEGVFTDIVIACGDSLVTLTPVKTGRLKGNWIMTTNSPSLNSLIRYDHTGDFTMSDIIEGAMSLTLGDVAYIVNNLTYAEHIEHGGSRSREPNLMLGTTEARFEHLLMEIVERYKV